MKQPTVILVLPVYIIVLSCLCVCYERTDSVYGDQEKGEEWGEKRGKGEMRRKGVGERRRGAGEWISIPPFHPLCYGTAFLRPTPSFQHRSSKSCI
jgi:hypothetical protein